MAKKKKKQLLYLKRIPGFPKAYATIDGKILFSKDGIRFYERVCQVNHNGYLVVKLTDDIGETHMRKVHRLVAKTFLPNPNNLEIVMHLDNNPKNNRVDNLKWGTQSDNMLQMVKDGRQRKSKLESYIPKITSLLEQGFKPEEIHRILNLSKTSTYRMTKRIIKNISQ